MGEFKNNKLFYGDNLKILRSYIPDESVDLIYLDPPFNSKRAYNVIFKDKTGEDASAQIEAFEDTWKWTPDVRETYDEIMGGDYSSELKDAVSAFKSFMPKTDMMAYLTMMAVRLWELRRVLKETGSIYLHCDPTASHYLKVLMDQIFGASNFQNEIAWKRTSAHSGSKRWGPVHDILLFYSKSSDFVWNTVYQDYSEKYLDKFYKYEDDRGRFTVGDLTGSGTRSGDSGKPWKGVNPTDKGRHWGVPNKIVEKITCEDVGELSVQEKLDLLDGKGYIYWPPRGSVPRLKRYLDEDKGVPIVDMITDINVIQAHSNERLGYPTQKPLALLERIIEASSGEGDVVLDPFCGCGTAVVAAETLGRKWIGIDVTHLAVALMKNRLKTKFDLDPNVDYDVIGEPESVGAAQALAEQSKSQFEFWAVSLVNGKPHKSKGGGDSGIDGLLYFKDFEGKWHKIIIEVKGGGYQPKDVRALHHVMEREKAPMGLLIALKPPTQGMLTEAAELGKWKMPGSERKYPVMQIFTVEEYFDGRMPDLPDTSETLKKAKRNPRANERQRKLDL